MVCLRKMKAERHSAKSCGGSAPPAHCASSHPEGALCVSICKNRPYVNDLLTNLKAKSTCYKPPLLPFFCALRYCLNKTHNFRKRQVRVLHQDAKCTFTSSYIYQKAIRRKCVCSEIKTKIMYKYIHRPKIWCSIMMKDAWKTLRITKQIPSYHKKLCSAQDGFRTAGKYEKGKHRTMISPRHFERGVLFFRLYVIGLHIGFV